MIPGSARPMTLIVIVMLTALAMWACPSSNESTPEPPRLKLTLAIQPTLFSGLIAVADEKGFFRREGLEVHLNLHGSGRECLEQVCRGKAQIATVADMAFLDKTFEDPSIRVLASIGTTRGSQIVARRDRGIASPQDLRGKRIGFSQGTANDYFLYSFLLTQNIPQQEVTLVDMAASHQVEALVQGRVDAISAFETYAFEAGKQMGDRVLSWDSQDETAYHWLLAFRQSLVPSDEPLQKLLSALLRAEAAVAADESEAKAIISRQWGFDPSFVQQFWAGTRLKVSLSQSIVTGLQNYSRWHIARLDKPVEPPDVIAFLHVQALEAVAPQLVTIYR